MAYVSIAFLGRPEFHGLARDGRQEWPPSPLRLLGALTAGAHSLVGARQRARSIAAISRMTRLPAPSIHTSETVPLEHPDTYTEKAAPPADKVGVGALEKFLDLTQASLSTASRTAKPTRGTLMAVPTIVFEIAGVADDDIADLQIAADAVGYFGRSQDHAVLTVSAAAPDLDSLDELHMPNLNPGGRHRGWTARSLVWFEDRHQAIMNDPGSAMPYEAGAYTLLDYRSSMQYASAHTEVDAVGEDDLGMAPVMFSHGIRIGDIPGVLRGIGSSSTETSVIPLVNFNQPTAKCYGLAVRGPLDLRLSRAAAIRAHLGAIASSNVGVESRLFGQYAAMSTGRQWITATPIRTFGHTLTLESALAASIPGEFQIEAADTRPLATWQQRLPDDDLTDGLSQWFVRFRTSADLQGPMLIGAAVDHGFGLCVPIPATENAGSE